MIDSEIVLLKFKGLLNKNPIKPAGIPSSHRGGWGLPQGHLKGGDKPEGKAKALKESAKDIEYEDLPSNIHVISGCESSMECDIIDTSSIMKCLMEGSHGPLCEACEGDNVCPHLLNDVPHPDMMMFWKQT